MTETRGSHPRRLLKAVGSSRDARREVFSHRWDSGSLGSISRMSCLSLGLPRASESPPAPSSDCGCPHGIRGCPSRSAQPTLPLTWEGCVRVPVCTPYSLLRPSWHHHNAQILVLAGFPDGCPPPLYQILASDCSSHSEWTEEFRGRTARAEMPIGVLKLMRGA